MRFLISILILVFSSSVFADAYVDASKPFVEIEDVNQQAQTWAICAASYDIMSTIMQSRSPDRSRQLSDLGSGAKLAVAMSLITNDLEPNISMERFKLLWADSAAAMTQWPQKHLTMILADAERLGVDGEEEFGKKINATVVACINNLEGQRFYIASWQELVKSGLLEIPEQQNQ